MSNSNDDSARLQLLEEKFEYQDQTIETLNQVIIDQQRELDQLRYELNELKSIMSIMEDKKEKQPEPPPPHY